ncbi:MAG: hypothetical protein FJ008_04770 [Chloroflexi bacterium]|nr:hypothetical protein [Chloroflexota bacterium]MBM3154628.1 hypothetical protein [Chloroflexota bacterium]MBM3173557.1 hypothetical protein [Chloroflexota bacterium]MBM3174886.1 hypothetical protein [Chloroflexota bacterium]MBM4450055.1 hypothetical protein [Chloroflexota bacterium]
MMIINKESITATRKKLNDTKKESEVIDEVKKMIEIKSALQWRSDAIAPCCGSLSSYTCQLGNEIELLSDVLKAIEGGDRNRAGDLLEMYARIVEENQGREPAEPRFS